MTATARCHPRRPSFDGFATGPCYECYLAQRGITADQELDELWGPVAPAPPTQRIIAVAAPPQVAPPQARLSNFAQQLVAGVLCNPQALGTFDHPIGLTDPILNTIWQAILVTDRDAPSFAVAVADTLLSQPGKCTPTAFDDIGGPVALLRLIDETEFAAVNIPYYAKAAIA